MKKALILTLACIFGYGAVTKEAHADFVFAPTSLANAVMTVSEMSEQLEQIESTLQQLKDLLNIQNKISEIIGKAGANITNFSIPSLGQNQTQGIGYVLGTAGMGLSLYNLKNNLPAIQEDLTSFFSNGLNNQSTFSMSRGIFQQFRDLPTPTNGNAETLLSETDYSASIIQGAINTAESDQLLKSMLYTNTTTPSNGLIQRTGIMRHLYQQNASIGGLETSIAGQTSATTSSQDLLAQFSTNISKSKDLRGDIQANSAAALALYQTISQQTLITGWIVHMQSVQNVTKSNINGPTLKWTDYQAGK